MGLVERKYIKRSFNLMFFTSRYIPDWSDERQEFNILAQIKIHTNWNFNSKYIVISHITNNLVEEYTKVMEANLSLLGKKRKSSNYSNQGFNGVSPRKIIHFGREVTLVDLAKENELYKECIDDMRVIKMVREINSCREWGDLGQIKIMELRATLHEFKNAIDCALNRLQTCKPCIISDNPEMTDIPCSPASLESFSIVSNSQERCESPDRGFKLSDKDVVHGKGVVATRDFNDEDTIADYEGELAYRIFCEKDNDRFHAFTISEENGDFVINCLEKDTYVAWSGVTVQSKGRFPIELGRNGSTDIRYLNHSKNANVKVIYPEDKNILDWSDRENLRLVVVATRDIRHGEELVFDYDPDKHESEIDFSTSSLEEITNPRKNEIYNRIQKLQANTNRQVLEKVVVLPEILDNPISEIIQLTICIRLSQRRPALTNEFISELNSYQKNILRAIFATNEPDLEDLKKQLRDHLKDQIEIEDDCQINQLSTEKVTELKKYLLKSIFNNKHTLISSKELKSGLFK